MSTPVRLFNAKVNLLIEIIQIMFCVIIIQIVCLQLYTLDIPWLILIIYQQLNVVPNHLEQVIVLV